MAGREATAGSQAGRDAAAATQTSVLRAESARVVVSGAAESEVEDVKWRRAEGSVMWSSLSTRESMVLGGGEYAWLCVDERHKLVYFGRI